MRLLPAALGVAILAGALAVALTGGSSASGQPAPALPPTVLAGPPTRLNALRGEPVVVDFFASWCGPCKAEAPVIRQAQAALKGRAHLVAVDWSDSRGYALAFLRRFHWSFPVLYDANGAAGYAYGIQGLPTMFVLNAHGVEVRRLVGPQTLRSIIRAVTAAGSAHD